MKKIILIRHATTVSNELGIIQGQKDSQISLKGKSDTKYLANDLEGCSFDKIFSSDLERTINTAKFICEKNGWTTNIITDSLLREVDYGDYSGVSDKNKSQLHKDFKTTLNFVPPNGESYASMIERIKRFISVLFNTNFHTALIVAHAGCIRAFFSILENKDYDFNLQISNRFIAELYFDDNNEFKSINIIHS